MRHIKEPGLSLIKKFEGFRSRRYFDPAGFPTIGFGHLILRSEEIMFSTPINREIAESLLRIDVVRAERAVLRNINVPLTDNQFDALVSFTFNLGGGALQRSTLRRKINREDHSGAAREFGRWVWAGGRKLKGLIRRRAASAELYRS